MRVRVKILSNLHAVRHYCVFSHDPQKAVERLKTHFKLCFWALQSWFVVTTGHYYERKEQLMQVVDEPVDREVLRIARDWRELAEDRKRQPHYYFEAIEQWGGSLSDRLFERSDWL